MAIGFYVFEHLPTGQRYTGTSVDVKTQVDRLKKQLTTASGRNERLNALAKRENDFKIRITEFDDLQKAREFERKFRANIPRHLLIN